MARPLHRPRTQEAAEPSVGLGLELRTQCYQTNTHLSWGNLQYRSGLPSDTSFPYLPSKLSHVDTHFCPAFDFTCLIISPTTQNVCKFHIHQLSHVALVVWRYICFYPIFQNKLNCIKVHPKPHFVSLYSNRTKEYSKVIKTTHTFLKIF